MLSLLWIGIIAIVAISIIWLIRRQQSKPLVRSGDSRQLPPVERTVFTLEIGDIVQYLDTAWVVEGRLTYDDHGYTWFEYLLQDGEEIRWLSVEEDDRVEVALLETTNALDIGQTPPQQLTFAGESYRCIESGTAQMTRTGSALRRRAEQCHYFDYKGPGDQVLSIEDWGGEIEVTFGKRIHPSMLLLLPGEGRSVYRG